MTTIFKAATSPIQENKKKHRFINRKSDIYHNFFNHWLDQKEFSSHHIMQKQYYSKERSINNKTQIFRLGMI